MVKLLKDVDWLAGYDQVYYWMTQMRNKIAKSVLIASTALIATQIPVGGGRTAFFQL